MQRVWVVGADSPLGHPVPACDIAVQLDGCGYGRSRRACWVMMETEATREPDEERPKRRSLSMEDLRRKYSWWPYGGGREGQPAPLIDVEAGEGDSAALRGVKSTKL
jgi:hypothetical protein